MPLPLGTYTVRVAHDTFTEASDTPIGSHTPDQDDSGAGYTVDWGSPTVIASGDYAEGTTLSASNNFYLGSLNLTGDFLIVFKMRASVALTVPGGPIHWGGPTAYVGGPSSNIGVAYDATAGTLRIEYETPGGGYVDGGAKYTMPNSAWTAEWHELALERVGNVFYLWVDGVQEGSGVDVSGSPLAGATFNPAVVLGNWDSHARLWADDFAVYVPAGAPAHSGSGSASATASATATGTRQSAGTGTAAATADATADGTSGTPKAVEYNAGGGGAATSRVIPYPTTKVGRLVCIVSVDNNTVVTWPAGWNVIESGNAGTATSAAIAYRDLDGGEGADFTVTHVSRVSSWAWVRVIGAGGVPSVAELHNSTASATPNPPAVTPAAGQNHYLYIAAMGTDNSGTISIVSGPSGYPAGAHYDYVDAGASRNGVAITARGKGPSTTEDPGVFTLSGADQYNLFTVALAPPGEAHSGTGGAGATVAATATGIRGGVGAGVCAAVASAVATGVRHAVGIAAAASVAAALATGAPQRAGTGSTEAVTAATAQGVTHRAGSGSATATGSAEGTGTAAIGATGSGSATATASATATGTTQRIGAGGAAATATATAQGASQRTGAASAGATGSATAQGAAQRTGAGSATATAAATAAGSAQRAGTGTATAAASATGAGVTHRAGTGSATATASATAAGIAGGAGTGSGSANAVASATATGSSQRTGTGSATGTAAAGAQGVTGRFGGGVVAPVGSVEALGAAQRFGGGTATATGSAVAAGTTQRIGAGSAEAVAGAVAAGGIGEPTLVVTVAEEVWVVRATGPGVSDVVVEVPIVRAWRGEVET